MMGVIPAWRLTEMFKKNPKLRATFDAVSAEAHRDEAASYVERDIAESELSPTSDTNPAHREDFTSLLDVAARKRQRDD